MTQRIIIDNRWDGHHGIGRYGREIISRLPPEAVTLYNRGKPLSLLDTTVAAVHNWQGYSYTPGFNFFNARLAKSIITVHDLAHLDIPEYQSLVNSTYYERLIKPTCRHAPFVFTGSEVSRQRIADWAGIDPGKIHVTGNGISDAFGLEGKADVADCPYLLSVGSDKAHKNTDHLLKAFTAANLPRECHLILVGSYPGLKSRTTDERIVFRDGLDDTELAALYRGCNGLVQPSLYEGFGLPLAEGMACGAPIAASDIPIFHEVCADTATFFDPRSIDALCAALEALFQTDREREKRVARAVERSKQFNWDAVATVVEEKLLAML